MVLAVLTNLLGIGLFSFGVFLLRNAWPQAEDKLFKTVVVTICLLICFSGIVVYATSFEVAGRSAPVAMRGAVFFWWEIGYCAGGYAP